MIPALTMIPLIGISDSNHPATGPIEVDRGSRTTRLIAAGAGLYGQLLSHVV